MTQEIQDNLLAFYGSEQHSQLQEIFQWFSVMTTATKLNTQTGAGTTTRKKKVKRGNGAITDTLVVVGNTGIGKSFIINQMLAAQRVYDVLNIGKLLDIYEHTNVYSIKDFIPKILKQRDVADVKQQKLLLIDSLEEYFAIQKTIIRDVVDSINTLHMPVVIVCERMQFENLEKKMLTKLTKEATVVHLTPPSPQIIVKFVQQTLGYKGDVAALTTLIGQSNGDLRHVANMLAFPTVQQNYNHKNYVLAVETAIATTFSCATTNLTDIFNSCASEPFIYGMLTYENYIHCKVKEGVDKNKIIEAICAADHLEKNLFKHQQWDLLEIYSFLSTIFPWKQMHAPATLLSSSTLQKFMNTKKKHRKNVFDF